MRIAILTSTAIRHRFFANALRARFPIVAIGYESTGYDPAAPTHSLPECSSLQSRSRKPAGLDRAQALIPASEPKTSTSFVGEGKVREPQQGDLTQDECRIVDDHFAERDRQEQIYFGTDSQFAAATAGCSVQNIEIGTLNTPETLSWLEAQNVDTVVVYGTNLIKPPLIDRWPGRMINLHLGLSPYYRGTATNFYPLLNEEPQFVGATIHLIDTGLDSGPIVRHARPAIVHDDMPHTIGCKAILAGIEAMIEALKCLDRDGRLTGVPQWSPPHARLYLRKDYHPRQVVDLYRKLDRGLIPRFVASTHNSLRHPRLIGGIEPA